MCDPKAILLSVLERHGDADKWKGADFERIKRISNSKVGEVGQDFIERLCRCVGLSIAFPESDKGKRLKQSPWDVSIEGVKFELKTATEDVSGSFQFNHVRYHRPYDALLCLAISPADIRFACWSKPDVSTGKAGSLVTMEKGANASCKLTKRPDQLYPISDFEIGIMDLVTRPMLNQVYNSLFYGQEPECPHPCKHFSPGR